MTDLYRLIGLGARGLNIVQQGTVGEIVTKKPVDRRELLEEAAGISGFRSRIQAAQRRLDKTSDNMARVSDIIGEVEKQVRVLKRQATRARNRADLKSSLREADFELFNAKAAKLVIDQKEDAQRHLEIEQSLENERAELEKLLAEQEELQGRMQAFDVNLIELRDKRRAQTELLNREKDRIQELELQLVSVDTKLVALLENIEKLSSRKSELEGSAKLESRELEKANDLLTSVADEKRAAEELVERIISERPEDLTSEASSVLSELRSDLSGADSLIEVVKSNLSNENTLFSKLEAAISAFKESVATKLEKLSSLLVSEREEREKEIKESRVREREAQQKLNHAQEELISLRANIARVNDKLEFITAQLTSVSNELITSESARLELEEKRSQINDQLRSVQETSSEDEEHTKNVIKLLNDTEEQILAIEDDRSAAQRSLAKIVQSSSELRRVVDKLQSEGSDKKLVLEKTNLELSMLRDEVWRLYSEAFEAPSGEKLASVLENAADDFDSYLSALSSNCDSLRRKLDREGEVDPQSIELCEVEEKRLEDLTKQYKDLASASEILNETIKKLKEISRQKFLHTFDSVQTKFTELIPRLFGGGSGKLELVNPEDPLESGVELNVRLPGKKVKSMELLSGGEKALVATALIIAMFLHRPSPICVLDEVDAPLDDANLERFLSLVREISSTTQMLVITHNKLTMAAVDRLVGITMQESGVSTALNVSVDEVEQDLDRWVSNA